MRQFYAARFRRQTEASPIPVKRPTNLSIDLQFFNVQEGNESSFKTTRIVLVDNVEHFACPFNGNDLDSLSSY
jgi:hypothetical protein